MPQDTPQRNYDQIVADRQHMLDQLNGMQRVLGMSLSDEAKAAIDTQIGRHRQRLALMDTVVQAYDALEADGYPEMDVEPSPTVQQELAEVLRTNQEHVKSQMSQVSDELNYVQELFGGRRSRRRAAAEEVKPSEGEGESKA